MAGTSQFGWLVLRIIPGQMIETSEGPDLFDPSVHTYVLPNEKVGVPKLGFLMKIFARVIDP